MRWPSHWMRRSLVTAIDGRSLSFSSQSIPGTSNSASGRYASVQIWPRSRKSSASGPLLGSREGSGDASSWAAQSTGRCAAVFFFFFEELDDVVPGNICANKPHGFESAIKPPDECKEHVKHWIHVDVVVALKTDPYDAESERSCLLNVLFWCPGFLLVQSLLLRGRWPWSSWWWRLILGARKLGTSSGYIKFSAQKGKRATVRAANPKLEDSCHAWNGTEYTNPFFECESEGVDEVIEATLVDQLSHTYLVVLRRSASEEETMCFDEYNLGGVKSVVRPI